MAEPLILVECPNPESTVGYYVANELKQHPDWRDNAALLEELSEESYRITPAYGLLHGLFSLGHVPRWAKEEIDWLIRGIPEEVFGVPDLEREIIGRSLLTEQTAYDNTSHPRMADLIRLMQAYDWQETVVMNEEGVIGEHDIATGNWTPPTVWDRLDDCRESFNYFNDRHLNMRVYDLAKELEVQRGSTFVDFLTHFKLDWILDDEEMLAPRLRKTKDGLIEANLSFLESDWYENNATLSATVGLREPVYLTEEEFYTL